MRLTLKIGSRTISLKRDEFHSPEGDLIIYLSNEKVIMAVDMIAPGWIPLLDFDITGKYVCVSWRVRPRSRI